MFFRIPKWSLLGPGAEEKWYGMHNYKPEWKWNVTADVMVDNFKDSGHPVIRATSALGRWFLKKIKVKVVRFTSVVILRMQSFCFARSILQISSVPTEQSRIGAADSWSIIFKHGEFNCESDWAVMSKIGAWRGEYVGTNTRDKVVSDLWISWVH